MRSQVEVRNAESEVKGISPVFVLDSGHRTPDTGLRTCMVSILMLFYFYAAAYQGDYGTESIFSAGAGSRADAMGGAFAAVADDASASYYNPAGLALVEKQTAAFLHFPMYEGAIYDAVSYCVPILDFGSIAASVYRFSAGTIAGYDITDKATVDFSPEEYKATLSYAGKITENLYAGFNADVFSSKIGGPYTAGFGADAGVLYMPFDFFSAGFVIHNIIKPNFLNEGLPQKYTLGLALKYGAAGFVFRLASDCSLGESEAFKNSSGAEITWLDVLSVRAGYNDARLTFGGGIKLAGAQADYAFVTGGLPGGLHKFSFSYGFGQTLAEQKEARRQAMLEEVRKLVDKKMAVKTAEKSLEYYNKSYSLFKSGDLEAALIEAEKAIDWNSGNANAVKMKVFLEGRLKEKVYNEAGSRQGKNQYFESGVNFFIRKQYSDALLEWEKALKADPGNRTIVLYMKKAREKNAPAAGQAAAAPGNREAAVKIYYAAVNSYTTGDLEKAAALWKQALEMNPGDIRSMRGLEKAEMELEELQKRGVK